MDFIFIQFYVSNLFRISFFFVFEIFRFSFFHFWKNKIFIFVFIKSLIFWRPLEKLDFDRGLLAHCTREFSLSKKNINFSQKITFKPAFLKLSTLLYSKRMDPYLEKYSWKERFFTHGGPFKFQHRVKINWFTMRMPFVLVIATKSYCPGISASLGLKKVELVFRL